MAIMTETSSHLTPKSADDQDLSHKTEGENTRQSSLEENTPPVKEAQETNTDTVNQAGEETTDQVIDNKTDSDPHTITDDDTRLKPADGNSKVDEEKKPPNKTVTLADLIYVCRDRGLQCFNDKPNVPEADKRWKEANREISRRFRHSGHRRTPSDYNSSDNLRSVSQQTNRGKSSRGKRSRHSRHEHRRSRRSIRRRDLEQAGSAHRVKSTHHPDASTHATFSDTNSAHQKSSTSTRHDALTVSSTRHQLSASPQPDICHRMSALSRRNTALSRHGTMTRSSIQSVLELYGEDDDIDAEEVLLRRMHRKSKRRNESMITLTEKIQQKHKEVETMPKNLQPIADRDENNPNDQDEKDKAVADLTENVSHSSNGNNNTDDSADGASKHEMHEATNSVSGEDTKNDDITVQSRNNQNLDDGKTKSTSLQTSIPNQNSAVDTLSSRPTSNASKDSKNKERSFSADKVYTEKLQDQNTGKIEEIRIQEGDMTLVLYGVTAIPQSDNTMTQKNSNDSLSDKSTNDSNFAPSVDPGQNSNSVNEVKAIQGCQADLPLPDCSAGGKTEMINKNTSQREKLNGAISPETRESNKIDKQVISDNNGRLKNVSDTISSSSRPDVSQSDYQTIHDSDRNLENNSGGEGKQSKSSSKCNNFSRCDLREYQSSSSLSSKKNAFNNSTDLNFDKDALPTNVEQQSEIDENIKFQGAVNIETSINYRKETDTFNELDDQINRDKSIKVSDHCISPLQDCKQEIITISMSSDNLRVEKQTIEQNEQNTNLKTYERTVMKTADQTPLNTNVDENIGMVAKKSYGNGFLISVGASGNNKSGDENSKDDENGNVKAESDSNTNDSNNNNSRTESSRAKETAERETQRSKQSVAASSRNRTSSTASTPSETAAFKKIHGAARLMLLMSQLKKSYEDEEQTQQSFLKEIGNTRKSLRSNYHKLRNGEDMQSSTHDTKSDLGSSTNEAESEVSLHLPLIDDAESKHEETVIVDVHEGNETHKTIDVKLPNVQRENETRQESRVKANKTTVKDNSSETSEHDTQAIKQDNNSSFADKKNKHISSDEGTVAKPPINESAVDQAIDVKDAEPKIDTHWDPESQVHRQIKTGFKTSRESNESISEHHANKTAIKQNVKSKLDTHWDPESQVYKQLNTKHKVTILNSPRLTNELNKLKQLNFVTGNVPSHNVYIEDARQRYRQLQNINQSNDSNIIRSRPKSMSRPKSDKTKPRVSNETRSRSTPRLIKTHLDESKNVYSKNQSVVRQSNENEDTVSHIPLRSKPYQRLNKKVKQSESDQDNERLEQDKKVINGYQQYIDDRDELPKVEALNRRINNRHKLPNNSYRAGKSDKPRMQPDVESDISNGFTKAGTLQFRSVRNKSVSSKDLDKHSDDPFHETESGVDSDDLIELGSPNYTDSIDLQETGSPASTKTTHRSKIPIGKAVEIMKSRSKFYKDASKHKILPREVRILKLFEELQRLKFGRPLQEPSGISKAVSLNIIPRFNNDLREFLMMDYRFSDSVLKHRSNLELNRFLHEEINYETCSKGRELYKHPSRREKALEVLRQKFYKTR